MQGAALQLLPREPPWCVGLVQAQGTGWVIYNNRAHVPSSWLGQLSSLACPGTRFCQLTPPLAGLSRVQLGVLPRGLLPRNRLNGLSPLFPPLTMRGGGNSWELLSGALF